MDTEPEILELPHNLECEQALLGALLVNNDVSLRIDKTLTADDFFEPVHGRIFDACMKLIGLGQVADPVKLKPYFQHDEALTDIGGAQYLVRLAASAATIINASDYSKTVITFADRRKIIELADEIASRAYTQNVDGTKDTQDYIDAALSSIRNERLKDGRLVSAAGGIAALRAETEEAARQGGMAGVTTGIPELDQLMGRLRKGSLVINGARPAMGKTALALEMMLGAARADHGCLIFSTEMDEAQVTERLVSRMTTETPYKFSYEDFAEGKLSALDMETWTECEDKLVDLPYYIQSGRCTISNMRRTIKMTKVKLEAQGKTLDIVYVDYLQKMHGTAQAKKQGKYAEVSEISGDLKDLAIEFNIVLLVCAQLGRDVEKRDDKTPMNSDLKDSGSIEQDADMVIFPHRAEVYVSKEKIGKGNDAWVDWNDRMGKVRGKITIYLSKKRRGKTGQITLTADMGCNHIHRG